MAVKNYKPTSPGRRGMSVSDFSEITRGKPERSLLDGQVSKTGGRLEPGVGRRAETRGNTFPPEKLCLAYSWLGLQFGSGTVGYAYAFDDNRAGNLRLTRRNYETMQEGFRLLHEALVVSA